MFMVHDTCKYIPGLHIISAAYGFSVLCTLVLGFVFVIVLAAEK